MGSFYNIVELSCKFFTINCDFFFAKMANMFIFIVRRYFHSLHYFFAIYNFFIHPST